MNMNMNWLRKHRPTSVDDFICYREEMAKAKEWILQMKESPHLCKKVLYIMGPSGVGKTTMCEVLLEEFGFRVIEYNSSELRSQKKITEGLEKSLTYKNVFEMMEEENRPAGFMIDELGGLIGTADKGGFTEFLDILKSNVKYENYVESLKQKKKSAKPFGRKYMKKRIKNTEQQMCPLTPLTKSG